MKNSIIGVLIGIILTFLVYFFLNKKQENEEVLKSTQLIEKQIKNTSKLVVTEGYFSDIISYSDAKKYLGDFFSFDKKALVVVNAEVLVSFDLQQIEYHIDEKSKTLEIKKIPEAEIKIFPKLSFHDLDQSSFNPFTAQDHNKIRHKAEEVILTKVEESSLKKNAKNRLITELSKILILTKSMGWTLTHHNIIIEQEDEFLKLQPKEF